MTLRRFPPPWSVEEQRPLVRLIRFRLRRGGRRLTLFGQPMMFGDPFFGFRLGIELAEQARSVIWPRHFDAPAIPPLHRC